KGLGSDSTHELSPNVRLHLLRVPRVSGMPVAFLPRLAAVRKYVRALGCDVVHGQGTEAGYAWMATWLGLPNVITVHGILRLTHAVSRPPMLSVEHVGRWIETATFKRVSNVIAISDFVEEKVSRLAPRARFFSAGNPIDRRFFEMELDAVPREPTAVYLGRITPEKGLIDLMRAAVILDESGVEATIAVLGRASGRDGLSYEARCKDVVKGLRNVRVEFRGWVPDEEVWDLLRRAACLALPSHDESFSMAVAEAMALGTPAVAYAAGAVPERIDHGLNGALVPDGDVAGLARELRSLLEDPSRAAEWGRAARDKARAWHPDTIAQRTVEAYETILAPGA
ncbi:MAG TPA: glycosyltransferase family 4 protein, partial [Actinomycetota bacterium]|nr:glycosyltransferase family 4 protein [Actinomycetota bacterium]